jgi:predicted phage terminase large subunit-like protein
MSRWEQEPGSAGKRESWRLVKKMAGVDAKGIPSQGDKIVRAKPLAAQAEAGNVYLLAGAWNERWLNHMHGQPDWAHDDEMDAAAGAFTDLTGPRSTSVIRSYQG